MTIIPQDRATWPTGDKIWDFCRAIAVAEGYGPPDNNPTRLCNPGDISDGYNVYGGEPHSGSLVTQFPTHETGWKWLYDKLQSVLNGGSCVYRPTMTFTEFAQTYAGDWQNWLTNVCSELGVDPGTTLEEWYAGNPTSENASNGIGGGS